MICERCHSQLVLFDNYEQSLYCLACGHIQGEPIRPRWQGMYPEFRNEDKHRPKTFPDLPEGFKVAARKKGRPVGHYRY